MRRSLGVVVSMLVVAMALAGYAVPASAAVGDRVRTMAIDYTVTADGVLHVTETIDYHFADPDRHGIFRDLVIREPFVDDRSKDQKYDVSNIQVSSPTAPDSFETATTKTNKGRDQVLRIKIGSSNGTVPGEDATYQISYEVRGALRHFEDHSEPASRGNTMYSFVASPRICSPQMGASMPMMSSAFGPPYAGCAQTDRYFS